MKKLSNSRAHLVLQVFEGELDLNAGVISFPDQGQLVAPAFLDMAVHTVVAHVGLPADEVLNVDIRKFKVVPAGGVSWTQRLQSEMPS